MRDRTNTPGYRAGWRDAFACMEALVKGELTARESQNMVYVLVCSDKPIMAFLSLEEAQIAAFHQPGADIPPWETWANVENCWQSTFSDGTVQQIYALALEARP